MKDHNNLTTEEINNLLRALDLLINTEQYTTDYTNLIKKLRRFKQINYYHKYGGKKCVKL